MMMMMMTMVTDQFNTVIHSSAALMVLYSVYRDPRLKYDPFSIGLTRIYGKVFHERFHQHLGYLFRKYSEHYLQTIHEISILLYFSIFKVSIFPFC